MSQSSLPSYTSAHVYSTRMIPGILREVGFVKVYSEPVYVSSQNIELEGYPRGDI